MKCKVAVTFEFDVSQPLTWRGEVSAGGIHTLVSRAVREAKKAYPNRSWTSLVVCVLERLDTTEDLEDPAELGNAESHTDS
jgi:hypothetical protein